MTEFVACHDMNGDEYEVPIDELQWRPSAYAIVVNDNSILVSRQFGGLVLPGGGLERGELPEKTVIRETYEETGIHVAEPEIIGLKSTFFKLPESHGGKYIQSLMLYYVCKFVGGKLSTDHFNEYDRAHTGNPLWLPLAELNTAPIGGTVDWREFAVKAAHENLGY